QRPGGTGKRCNVRQVRLYQGSILLRPHAHVDDPLVEPRGLERSCGHFGEGPRDVRPAKSSEGFFRPRTDVGVARVRRRAYPRQDEEGHKVCLIEHVYVGVGGEIPTIPNVPERWVKGDLATRVPTVLNCLVLADRGHEGTPAAAHGKERLVLLAER